MNKPELPVVYHVYKKLRLWWTKSKHPDKEWVILLFDESLKELEENYLIQLELWNEQEDAA